MSTFAVEATLIHPEHRERSVTADFLVDTGLDSRERTTIFVGGPPGCSPLLGSVTLGAFALAADPRHQRLVPARPLGHV